MEYGQVNEDLIQAFPELSEPYQQLKQEWDGEQPGQYTLFEAIFARYVENLLAAPSGGIREKKLEAIFSFIEQMLASGGEVENLGFIGMLEGRSSSWLQASRPYLGSRAEVALDTYAPDWRTRSAENPSRFSVESRECYGIESIVREVLAGAT